MSRDSAVKLCLISGVVALNAVLLPVLGLHLPPADLLRPLGIGLLLGIFAWFYAGRGAAGFVMCLLALAHVTVYTAAYTVLMYSVTTTAAPLVDDWLTLADRAMGVFVSDIVAWLAERPGLIRFLETAYNSLTLQTALLVVVLGFRQDRIPLEGFVLQFMISTLACITLLLVAPAEGPFSDGRYELSESQQRYVKHFQELRSGQMTVCTWRNAEGLITFPSFHTTWAMLLAWGFRNQRWLFLPAVLLNAAVIVSTLTTGWHYFSDVLGGIALGSVTIVLCRRLEGWLYDEDGQPRPAIAAEPPLYEVHRPDP